jgi:cytochrome b subunit of formate dehydrogenase
LPVQSVVDVAFDNLIPIAYADALGDASEIGGIDDYGGGDGDTVRDKIRDIVQQVLLFVALAATVVIVIAGIILIVGMGSDESREKTKKIILYAIIGIIVIAIAEAFVILVTTAVDK